MRGMKVCDVCKTEISGPDRGYSVTMSRYDVFVKYDCCTKKCCAEALNQLAKEWGLEK